MLFPTRFRQILSRIAVPPTERLWINTHLLSAIVYVFIAIWLYIEFGEFSLRYANRSAAWTSVILIGLSFTLSAICYFWNFADSKIVYRKYLGVVGFEFGLVHAVLTFYLITRRFDLIEYLSTPQRFWPFVLGLCALLYFAFMTLISNRYAVHELGGVLWRRLLRLGYVAFILTIGHFTLLNLSRFREWIADPATIMPLGLVVFIGTLVILCLRLLLEVAVRKHKGDKVTSPSVLTAEKTDVNQSSAAT